MPTEKLRWTQIRALRKVLPDDGGEATATTRRIRIAGEAKCRSWPRLPLISRSTPRRHFARCEPNLTNIVKNMKAKSLRRCLTIGELKRQLRKANTPRSRRPRLLRLPLESAYLIEESTPR